MSKLDGEWEKALAPEFSKKYYQDLYSFVKSAYNSGVVYPDSDDIFNAYHLTPLDKVKVAILGSQPYSEGRSDGLAFSVRGEGELPIKLKNIFKELHDDIGCSIPEHGSLRKWAEQGVFLLNNVLTVGDVSGSHYCAGWEHFTDATLNVLDNQDRPIVFLLWGREAQKKAGILRNPKHLVLQAPHPSALSAYRGFFGCKHFSKANEFLVEHGQDPIDWQL